MPRSGTTLVQSIVGTNNEVGIIPETHIFNLGKEIFKPYLSLRELLISNFRIYRQCRKIGIKVIIFKDFRKLIIGFDKVMSKKFINSKFYVEKTPLHLLYVDQIREVLPHARFIFVRRNINDNIQSYLKLNSKWNKSLLESTKLSAEIRWLRDNYLIINQFRNDDSVIISYDNLVDPTTTTKTIQKLERFLGIPLSSDKRSLQESAKKVVLKDESWKVNNLNSGVIPKRKNNYQNKNVIANFKALLELLEK